MVRIVKHHKKRKTGLEFLSFAGTLFFISSLLFLGSSLFLRSYNNSLSASTQTINNEIASLNQENEAMKEEINSLASIDRISEMTSSSGLAYNQNNIITITDSKADEETTQN